MEKIEKIKYYYSDLGLFEIFEENGKFFNKNNLNEVKIKKAYNSKEEARINFLKSKIELTDEKIKTMEKSIKKYQENNDVLIQELNSLIQEHPELILI